MFYCPLCAEKRHWPESMSRSGGRCEVCGHPADCYDVPSRYLPLTPAPPEPPDGD